MAPDGSIISRLDHGVPPPYELLPESVTVQGNDAFVLVAALGQDSLMVSCPTELHAFRLDPQSNWLPVRSIPIACAAPTGLDQLPVGPLEPSGPSLRQE